MQCYIRVDIPFKSANTLISIFIVTLNQDVSWLEVERGASHISTKCGTYCRITGVPCFLPCCVDFIIRQPKGCGSVFEDSTEASQFMDPCSCSVVTYAGVTEAAVAVSLMWSRSVACPFISEIQTQICKVKRKHSVRHCLHG